MVESMRVDCEHLRFGGGLNHLLRAVRGGAHHEGVGITHQLHRLAFRFRVSSHELNIEVSHLGPLVVQRVVFGNAHDEDFELGSHVVDVLSM